MAIVRPWRAAGVVAEKLEGGGQGMFVPFTAIAPGQFWRRGQLGQNSCSEDVTASRSAIAQTLMEK